jgi:hypothetical protein
MKVILSDVDGTIVDVNQRIVRCLADIGVEAGPAPSATADQLPRPLRSRFFDLFLSERYTHLDEPIPSVIELIAGIQRETGLPLVFLSGRPASMRKSTRAAIENTGLAVQEIILRPRNQRMRRTTEFKVDAIESRGYEPQLVLDDDAAILAAFAAKYPEATYYQVRGPQATPWPD